MDKLNIMIVGVGGQGTLLASRILGKVAVTMNLDVKVSEVHGMAQRGGSVVTYIKLGKIVHSPLIEEGEADIILSFEQLEAMRWFKYLKKGGRLIINAQKIDPMPVITGAAQYPDGIVETLCERCSVTMTDALDIAVKCGSPKAVNVVMIGIMAGYLDIGEQLWTDAVREVVPVKAVEANLTAFKQGLNVSREI